MFWWSEFGRDCYLVRLYSPLIVFKTPQGTSAWGGWHCITTLISRALTDQGGPAEVTAWFICTSHDVEICLYLPYYICELLLIPKAWEPALQKVWSLTNQWWTCPNFVHLFSTMMMMMMINHLKISWISYNIIYSYSPKLLPLTVPRSTPTVYPSKLHAYLLFLNNPSATVCSVQILLWGHQ